MEATNLKPGTPRNESRAAAALLGLKGVMTQLYDEQGRAVPVTAIEVGSDCVVVSRRTGELDGYEAVQLGFGRVKAKQARKPLAGHCKRAGLEPVRFLREVTAKGNEELKPGERVGVDSFQPGDMVQVTGRTRGRGFAGGVERWNWSSGPRSHGSMSHRRIGSVGSGTSPGRVLRGRHLPGHYGNEQVTIRNLYVVKVEPEAGRLYVSGAVPGRRGSLLLVKKLKSAKKEKVGK